MPPNIPPWKKIELPAIAPIKQFAFPEKDRMLVRTNDGLFSLRLARPVELTRVMSAEEIASLDNGDSWGPDHNQKLSFDGESWFFHGADGGDITLCDLSTGERLELAIDEPNVALIVDSSSGQAVQLIPFALATNPEEFSICGFSYDEKYLVLCTTHELKVFVSPHGKPAQVTS